MCFSCIIRGPYSGNLINNEIRNLNQFGTNIGFHLAAGNFPWFKNNINSICCIKSRHDKNMGQNEYLKMSDKIHNCTVITWTSKIDSFVISFRHSIERYSSADLWAQIWIAVGRYAFQLFIIMCAKIEWRIRNRLCVTWNHDSHAWIIYNLRLFFLFMYRAHQFTHMTINICGDG